MDLYPLIDELDDLVTNAKQGHLSSAVRVNKQEIGALLDEMRGAIPEELKQAHWIAENRDEMLTEARRETARALEEAREERARLLGRDEIAKEAEQRAQRLLGGARARERDIRLGADDFAGDTLARLEAYMAKLTDAVERGRGRLKEFGGDRVIERGGDRVVEGRSAIAAFARLTT